MTSASTLSEPGSVANVQTRGLPCSTAEEVTAYVNNIVELVSLDEDRLGESLWVMWKPGVRWGHIRAGLYGASLDGQNVSPAGLDNTRCFGGLTDAMRPQLAASLCGGMSPCKTSKTAYRRRAPT